MSALGLRKILELSESIRRNIESLDEYKKARVIASYVAMLDEVQTEQLIRDSFKLGKTVIVPITPREGNHLVFSRISDFSQLRPGSSGILEPEPESIQIVALEKAEMVVVPIVAWDERGFRLGHGKGFFDIALSSPKVGTTIGLAFEAQRVKQLPIEPHDIPLKMIVTEDRILRFTKK